MDPDRPRMLPLERRLPLVLAGVLVATLGTALFVTQRALIRGAEQGAHAGLTSALQALGQSLTTSAQQRSGQLRAAVPNPQIRELLQEGVVPPRDAMAGARAAVAALVGRDTTLSAVVLTDVHGRRVARWGADLVAALPAPRRAVPAAPEGHDPDDPWFSPFFIADGALYSWGAIHVRDGMGRPIGTLANLRRSGAQQQASLTETLRRLTGEEVSLFLRNEGERHWIGWPLRAVPPATLEEATTDSGPRFAVREGTGRVVTVEQRIDGTPWFAVLEVPVASIRARPERTTRRLASVFLLLAIGGAALTWWITRGVTHPIRQLTAAADDLAKGRSTRPVALDRDDELGQLAASFDAMAREITASRTELERRIDDVEHANRAKADFLAMMSHELRTPLNAIAGYTQLLDMGIHGPVTPDQREALTRIANSQRHLLHLIEDVLSFARLDAGRVEFTLAELPLARSVESALAMIEPQARAKRITLVAHRPETPLTVYADREKLDQILLNLLANAVKFTPADGVVEVGMLALEARDERGRELVQVRVTDTGPGVAPAHRATIFEPFVQGDRALNRPGEGVGLGLAISRDLTVGMGGHIALESGPEGGATFTVTLLRHAPGVPTGEPNVLLRSAPDGLPV